jgi:hypothetical protein
MRTWVKVSLVSVSVVILAFAALAGTTAFFALRHLDVGTVSEADITKEFEAIRSRFGTRPHLIEVADGTARTFKINRPSQPDGRPITTVHVLTWTRKDGEKFGTEVPIWLMRFSSINVLSHLGIAPDRFRLTVQDLQNFGPGIVVDYRRPEVNRVLIWVE